MVVYGSISNLHPTCGRSPSLASSSNSRRVIAASQKTAHEARDVFQIATFDDRYLRKSMTS